MKISEQTEVFSPRSIIDLDIKQPELCRPPETSSAKPNPLHRQAQPDLQN